MTTTEDWEQSHLPLDDPRAVKPPEQSPIPQSRKEKEMPQQLPIDLPPTEDELFGRTTCGYSGCNKGPILKSEMVPGCLQYGGVTHEEHFCSNRCRDKWRDQYFRGVPYDYA